MNCRCCGNSRVIARGMCNACYLADRKHRLKSGTWTVPYIDAAPACEHLSKLAAAGVTRQQMVELTGLHHTTIYRIVPGTKVHRKTVARILAVTPPRTIPTGVAGNYQVSGVGTARRLQALCRMGWPAKLLAARLGLASAEGFVGELTRGEHMRVQARTARSVAKLYDTLSMSPGPNLRVTAEAVSKGWAPPMAWDDSCDCDHTCGCEPECGQDHSCDCALIDDPEAHPRGVAARMPPKRTFLDRYRELRALGYTNDETIAWRLGISRRSLDRQVAPSRHGDELTQEVSV